MDSVFVLLIFLSPVLRDEPMMYPGSFGSEKECKEELEIYKKKIESDKTVTILSPYPQFECYNVNKDETK